MFRKLIILGILLISSFSLMSLVNVTYADSKNPEAKEVKEEQPVKIELVSPIIVKNPSNNQLFIFGIQLTSELLQTIAIFIGFLILLIQYKSALSLKKQEVINELKLKIYEGLVSQISDSSSKLSKVGVVGFTLPNMILEFKSNYEKDKNTPWTGLTTESLNTEFYSAIDSVADLMILLERYEIVFPNLKVFRLAFSVAADEATKEFQALFEELLGFIAWNSSPYGNKPHHIADDAKLEQIKILGSSFHDKVSILSSYVSDLGVEAQNTLLGKLFKNRVSKRVPLDPKYVVIATDKKSIEKLEKHFRDETDSGKRWKQYTEEIKT